jgi:hypothetical protein
MNEGSLTNPSQCPMIVVEFAQEREQRLCGGATPLCRQAANEHRDKVELLGSDSLALTHLSARLGLDLEHSPASRVVPQIWQGWPMLHIPKPRITQVRFAVGQAFSRFLISRVGIGYPRLLGIFPSLLNSPAVT